MMMSNPLRDDPQCQMNRQVQLEELRASLKIAGEQVARGEFYEDSDEFWEFVEREADEADRRGDPIDRDI